MAAHAVSTYSLTVQANAANWPDSRLFALRVKMAASMINDSRNFRFVSGLFLALMKVDSSVNYSFIPWIT